MMNYRKVPKFSDTDFLCCNIPKTQTRPNLRVFCQKDTIGKANSEDPRGAVSSGTPLFAKTYPSENLLSLWAKSFLQERLLIYVFIRNFMTHILTYISVQKYIQF